MNCGNVRLNPQNHAGSEGVVQYMENRRMIFQIEIFKDFAQKLLFSIFCSIAINMQMQNMFSNTSHVVHIYFCVYQKNRHRTGQKVQLGEREGVTAVSV